MNLSDTVPAASSSFVFLTHDLSVCFKDSKTDKIQLFFRAYRLLTFARPLSFKRARGLFISTEGA
jgi:hypothetical protein